MKYPTKKQIEKATYLQISKWYESLPDAKTQNEIDLIFLIANRLNEFNRLYLKKSK